jgi:YegS/Rv2252/BmrU family lipid kinase
VLDRPVCLIVNPSAGCGRAQRLLGGVEAELRGLGARCRVERTASIEHARELARAARDAGELVAAMGGDGLTGAVAGELCDGPGVLAVLPGGRGNDFARKLGIPHDPVAACALLADGRERRIDVAEVGGRRYLGILSAGFDSDVQEIANATRLRLGTLVYVYGVLRALRAWRPARWEVAVDGERRRFVGYSVAVANTGVYGGGMRLVPDAAVDDGRLDVVLSEDRPKLRFLAALPKVFKGTHVHEPGLVILRGTEVELAADRPFTAYADGDPIAALPATVRVRPGALRVVAPA